MKEKYTVSVYKEILDENNEKNIYEDHKVFDNYDDYKKYIENNKELAISNFDSSFENEFKYFRNKIKTFNSLFNNFFENEKIEDKKESSLISPKELGFDSLDSLKEFIHKHK